MTAARRLAACMALGYLMHGPGGAAWGLLLGVLAVEVGRFALAFIANALAPAEEP